MEEAAEAGRTSHHGIGAHDQGSRYHARGACESIGVGAKMSSSSVVDTHQTRDQIGFGGFFCGGGQKKPRIFGHAARFARVEGEVRKNSKPKIFGGVEGRSNAECKC